MRRILFVDDLRDFPLPDLNADIVRSSEAALEQLKSGKAYDEIWLDHDLGGDDTSMPIVYWLAERAFNGNPYPVEKVVVHTANPVGRKNIVSSLTRWGYNHQIASATSWK